MDFTLLSDESLEDLQLNDLHIIQKQNSFRFGTDAVLLSSFTSNYARYKKNTSIVDMGTGSGIIPILLSAKTNAEKIIGLEIQQPMAEMAQRSVIGNHLQDRISIINGDIRKARAILGAASYDIVVSNPPYSKVNSGYTNSVDTKAIAKHEISCTLNDLMTNSYALLKPKGEFFMVHRPERLTDIMDTMRKIRIEPKILRMVSPKMGKAPTLILLKGIKNAKAGLKVLPELIIYNEDGSYTQDVRTMYSM